jgi:hypothetical protein
MLKFVRSVYQPRLRQFIVQVPEVVAEEALAADDGVKVGGDRKPC